MLCGLTCLKENEYSMTTKTLGSKSSRFQSQDLHAAKVIICVVEMAKVLLFIDEEQIEKQEDIS